MIIKKDAINYKYILSNLKEISCWICSMHASYKRFQLNQREPLLPLSYNFYIQDLSFKRKSIAILKIFDFKILTYLHVFRSPEFIYAIYSR